MNFWLATSASVASLLYLKGRNFSFPSGDDPNETRAFLLREQNLSYINPRIKSAQGFLTLVIDNWFEMA